MPFGATHYRQATITGQSGAGTGYPMLLEVRADGIPVDAITDASAGASTVSGGSALQGACTDGAGVYWFSDSDNLYRYTRSGDTFTLDTSRDVSGDQSGEATQVNGLFYDAVDGVLLVGASDFAAGSSTAGWIREYDPTTLAYEDKHSVSALTCEGCCRIGDEYFVVYHDSATIERWNSSWVKQATYTQTDSALYGTRTDGWWQGASVIGSIIVVSTHGSDSYSGYPFIEGYQYRESADALERVFSFRHPYGLNGGGQQVFVDVGNSEMLLTDRTGDSVEVYDITWRPRCIDLEGRGGRADMGDIVVATTAAAALAGDGNGWRETLINETLARIWFSHTADLGSDADVRVYYGGASRTWTDAGASTYCDHIEDFNTDLGAFTNFYNGGTATRITSEKAEGSGAMHMTYTSNGGVYTADGTFMKQSQCRLFAYVYPFGANSDFWLMTTVSGSQRRSAIRWDATKIKNPTDGGTILSGSNRERWQRIEVKYDADASRSYWTVREIDGTLMAADSEEVHSNSTPTYRDVMQFYESYVDQIYTLPGMGQNEPSLGDFAAAVALAAETDTNIRSRRARRFAPMLAR